MKNITMRHLLGLLLLGAIAAGCCRSTPDVWDDTKSCGRHIKRGLSSLGGKQCDSRAVCCPEQFYCVDSNGGQDFDFYPLEDESRASGFSVTESTTPQPRQTPGDPGSPIPGIDSFEDPATNPQLSSIFQNVHFEYNQYLVKGAENQEILRKIASYMQSNPNTYLFVEGHCDERGPEAYNLALGSRRANAVRDILVQSGVHPDRIFTISYGKERPLIFDKHEEGWAQNRRAEFKIYQR